MTGDAFAVTPELNQRFAVRRRVGRGRFGEVFEAFDRVRSRRVALKQLIDVDPGALLRFKQEFRSLADVTHTNLAALHELFAADGAWWFTMELVDGEDFRSFVRGIASRTDFQAETVSGEGDYLDDDAPPVGEGGIFHEGRLRAALPQLAAAVVALHRAGFLHRDLKPSNVLVSREGRVVVLDFGLIAHVAGDGTHRTPEHRIIGTPAYMAPEQARGEAVSPASDWYAVGVMLFEALTGALPIGGSAGQILSRKQLVDAPDPRTVMPGLPDDLAELCVDLLQRDPRKRPGDEAVLSRLGGASSGARGGPASPDALPFIGREAERAALWAALADTASGRPVIVHLHGASGMGKSALARQFLDEAAASGEVAVLAGRCYERESVPFKALDGLMDALALWLRDLALSEGESLMPRDVQALARLFPALRRARVVVRAPVRPEPADPHELRRAAFEALRELLAAIAATRPLVVWLDDLQWGDADSAALLADLLGSPEAPALLLIASYRSDEGGAVADVVRALRPADRRVLGNFAEVREIALGPLGWDEARVLAARLLPVGNENLCDAVARESGGSPYFVHELVRHVGGAGRAAATDVSLQALLGARVASLPDDARRLLIASAIAGRPLPAHLLRRAAAIDDPSDRAVAVLRVGQLVRVRPGAIDQIEPFHDRVRETVVGGLDEGAVVAAHRALAEAIEADGRDDAEALAIHWRAAGDLPRASRHAERAAAAAAEKLAFGQAAALYRIALELALPEDRQRLRARLADALADAGHGAEAARAYLAAIENASAAEALRLRRRAAEQLLRSGYIDDGRREVAEVLRAVGLALPRTPARSLASLLYHRARLRLRGTGFRGRSESAVAPDDLARIDICWSVGNGLGGVDTARAADFQARHLLLALHAGEPYRIARALAWESIQRAIEGRDARDRAVELAAISRGIAERINHPHALAWTSAAAAIVAFCDGRWCDAVDLATQTIDRFREACRDIAWETGSMYSLWLYPALTNLGRIDEVSRRAPVTAAEAEERGDLYTVVSLRTLVLPLGWLAADRPVEARHETADAIARWSREGWHLQHQFDQVAQMNISLYEGDGAAALARVEATWPRLKRSLILRTLIGRVRNIELLGRAALAASVESHRDRSRALRLAAHFADRLATDRGPWPEALVTALRAGIAQQCGDRATALAGYEEASRRFSALEMVLHAAAVDRRRGELLGGDEGRGLVEGADAAMRERGVVRPERMACVLAPFVP